MSNTEHEPIATGIPWLTHRAFRCIAGALVATILASATAFAQELAGTDQAAVRALAKQLALQPSRVDALLQGVGFPPTGFASGPAAGYQKWPTLRKLEAAYLAAAGKGESNGREFLRVFSRNLAAEHSNAVRFEPNLKVFFEESPDVRIEAEARQLDFSPRYVRPTSPPSRELQSLLLTLERYTSRAPGGLQSLMSACCQIPQEQIYRTLATSETSVEAMTRAIQNSAIPPALQEKIRRMLVHTADRVHAFRYDETFRHYLESGPTRYSSADTTVPDRFAGSGERATGVASVVDDVEFDRAITKVAEAAARNSGMSGESLQVLSAMGEGALSTGGSSTGGSSAGGGGNSQRYRAVSSTIGGGSGGSGGGGGGGGGGISFAKMSKSPRGFGGVVFGNELTDAVEPSLLRAVWARNEVEPGSRPTGRFDLVFDDGVVGYSSILPEDLVHAAYVLVYRGFGDDFPPLDARSEGVGLAGLDTNYGDTIGDTVARRFVVHPALDGLPAGYAAVEADALSFMVDPSFIVERMRQAGASEAEQTAASSWVGSNRGFFKITDAPLRIERRDDGYVDVLRSATGRHDESVRAVALLTTQTFSRDGEPQDEFVTPFYDAVTGLVAAFPAFKDLNNFAEAVAVARWTKMEGVSWDSIPAEAVPGLSRRSVVKRTDGSIALVGGQAAILEVIASVEGEATKLSQAARRPGELEAIGKSLSELRRERAAVTFAIWRLRVLEKTRESASQVAGSISTLQARIQSSNEQATRLRQEALPGYFGEELGPRLAALDAELTEVRKERSEARQTLSTLGTDRGDPATLSVEGKGRLATLESALEVAATEFWQAPSDSRAEEEASQEIRELREEIDLLWSEDPVEERKLRGRLRRLRREAQSLEETQEQLMDSSGARESWESWHWLHQRADRVLGEMVHAVAAGDSE